MCKQVGLSSEEMNTMTNGMCMEYVYKWIEENDPEKQKQGTTRRAEQADFDSF